MEAQKLAKNRKRVMNMLLESEVKMTKLRSIAAYNDFNGTPESDVLPFDGGVHEEEMMKMRNTSYS